MRRIVVIDEGDNVATAIDDIKAGEVLEVNVGGVPLSVRAAETIRFGHKLALRPIPEGDSVIKYNEVVGTATRAIGVGEHVHVHNVVSNRSNAQSMRAAEQAAE
jgi:altronate dehydratase small subunit